MDQQRLDFAAEILRQRGGFLTLAILNLMSISGTIYATFYNNYPQNMNLSNYIILFIISMGFIVSIYTLLRKYKDMKDLYISEIIMERLRPVFCLAQSVMPLFFFYFISTNSLSSVEIVLLILFIYIFMLLYLVLDYFFKRNINIKILSYNAPYWRLTSLDIQRKKQAFRLIMPYEILSYKSLFSMKLNKYNIDKYGMTYPPRILIILIFSSSGIMSRYIESLYIIMLIGGLLFLFLCIFYPLKIIFIYLKVLQFEKQAGYKLLPFYMAPKGTEWKPIKL